MSPAHLSQRSLRPENSDMGERLKIYRMISEPEKQPDRTGHFNPDQDIKEGDRVWLEEQAAASVPLKEWTRVVENAVALHVIGEEPVLMDEEVKKAWEFFKEALNKNRGAAEIEAIPQLKIMAPYLPVGPHLKTVYETIGDEKLAAVATAKPHEVQPTKIAAINYYGMHALLTGMQPDFDREEAAVVIKNDIAEQYDHNTMRLDYYDGWLAVAQHLQWARIAGVAYELEEKDWQKLVECIETARHFGEESEFAECVLALAILDADEIKIPRGGGLELINHDAPSDPAPLPTPKSRKF